MGPSGKEKKKKKGTAGKHAQMPKKILPSNKSDPMATRVWTGINLDAVPEDITLRPPDHWQLISGQSDWVLNRILEGGFQRPGCCPRMLSNNHNILLCFTISPYIMSTWTWPYNDIISRHKVIPDFVMQLYYIMLGSNHALIWVYKNF